LEPGKKKKLQKNLPVEKFVGEEVVADLQRNSPKAKKQKRYSTATSQKTLDSPKKSPKKIDSNMNGEIDPRKIISNYYSPKKLNINNNTTDSPPTSNRVLTRQMNSANSPKKLNLNSPKKMSNNKENSNLGIEQFP